MKKCNVYRRTNTSTWPSSFNTFWKQMIRRSAGLPRLDLPEHLWGIRDMRSTHSREQDFMAITAEVEVLHQQLKGKGMYTVPPTFPTTSNPKPSNNVHFQPIDLAQKSSVQTMDQSLLNSSLNLLDDLP